MSASERMKLQGRRSELRGELVQLEARAENHMITIRDLIDPLEDWMDLEVLRAEQAMISLRVIVQQGQEIRDKIKKINKSLGDE